MVQLFLQEYQAIKSFIRHQFNVIVILLTATFSLVMQWYRPLGPTRVTNHFFYFFLLPVFVTLVILKKNPLNYGLKLGHYRIWIFYVLLTIVISFPLLLISVGWSDVHAFYQQNFNYYDFLFKMVPLLFFWEFLLRGFLLFGLKEELGAAAIVIQMVPFVLLHLGKPEVETVSCLLTGLWFGFIAYRGNSFWPAFLIHIFINFTVKYFINV